MTNSFPKTASTTANTVAIETTLSVAVALHAPQAKAANLFDNLDLEPDNGLFGAASFVKFGQQFLLDESDTVTEVRLSLFRVGSPSGSVRVELWSDDGLDLPGSLIGTLGLFEAAEVVDGSTLLTFDNPVSGLTPYRSYWIVLNFAEALVSTENGIGWNMVESDEGTNGAAKAAAQGRLSCGVWVALSDFTEEPTFSYFQLVTTRKSRN